MFWKIILNWEIWKEAVRIDKIYSVLLKLNEQRAKEKLFLDFYSPTGIMLMLVDQSTEKIIYANPLFYQTLKCRELDVINQTFSSVNIWVNNQDPETIQDFLKRRKTIKEQMFKFRTRSGNVKNFLLSAEKIDLIDILERLKIDIPEQIKIDEENLILYMARDITNITQNTCCISYRCLDDAPDYTMLFISDDCEKLTGYRVEDLVRNKDRAYGDIIHEDDQQLVADRVKEAVRRKTTFEIEYRIRTRSGEEKWVREKGEGVFAFGGELLALEGFIEDISEQKKSEDERQVLLKELNTLIEQRGEENE